MAAAVPGVDPKPQETISDKMLPIFLGILIISVAIWFLGYIQYAIFHQLANKITNYLKMKYLNALIRQDVAFFDQNNFEEMPADIP